MPRQLLDTARLAIAHLRIDESADLATALERTARVSADALSVARVGIWFFSSGKDELIRTAAWISGSPDARQERLELNQYPSYWDSVLSRRVVVANNAATDPATRSLSAYLESNGVGALLDVPIFLDGELCGVICHEHVGPARAWTEREIDFAVSVADMLSTLLESARRYEAEVELRKKEVAESKAVVARLEAIHDGLEAERDSLRDEVFPIHGFKGIIGESSGLREVLRLLRAVSETDATVLLLGESGVGKEILAAAVHETSTRRRRPFVRVNCAAIPRELYESEFLGHARGAFTGAVQTRRGRFELAEGGTLFLDEVADIPISAQASLLRVLQEGTYSRVGEEEVRTANVRVIAATNKDLDDEMRAGRFREDLYYRIGVFPISVPPLRERVEDIVVLARHFLARSADKLRRVGLTLSPADERRLREYAWPGNVRELQNVIERATILSPAPPLRLDLAWGHQRPRPALRAPRTKHDLEAAERAALELALRDSEGRIGGAEGAAARVGIAPSTFRDRLRSLGIPSPARARQRSRSRPTKG